MNTILKFFENGGDLTSSEGIHLLEKVQSGSITDALKKNEEMKKQVYNVRDSREKNDPLRRKLNFAIYFAIRTLTTADQS